MAGKYQNRDGFHYTGSVDLKIKLEKVQQYQYLYKGKNEVTTYYLTNIWMYSKPLGLNLVQIIRWVLMVLVNNIWLTLVHI